MGYRSTIISQECNGRVLPDWFRNKWSGYVNTGSNREIPSTLVASNKACKYYSNDFFEDYQRALNEIAVLGHDYFKENPLVVLVLSEDGVVTKIEIRKSSIKYFKMGEEIELDGVWTFGG